MQRYFKIKRKNTQTQFSKTANQPKREDYFTEGVDADELINKLIEIKSNKVKVWKNFYYKDFLGPTQTIKLTAKELFESPLRSNIPFCFYERDGKLRKMDFQVKLNKIKGEIDTDLSISAKVNLDQKTTTYSICANYVDTIQHPNTDKNVFIGTFDMEGNPIKNKRKIVAIEVNTSNYSDFQMLLSELVPAMNVRDYVTQVFNRAYQVISKNESQKRYHFYTQIPAEFLVFLTNDQKINDFKKIVKYEKEQEALGWFSEVSPVVLKLLKSMENIDDLLRKSKIDVELLNSIYF